MWQFLYREVVTEGGIEQETSECAEARRGSLEQERSRKRVQVWPKADDACFRNSKRVSVAGKGE